MRMGARGRELVAWARTPGHDVSGIIATPSSRWLPPAGRATLEIRCGEGRVARDLAACGHRVTAVDASPTLRAAAEADTEGRYLLADAAALPFADVSFDLIVAYNSLMDVQDMPAAVREAARACWRPAGGSPPA